MRVCVCDTMQVSVWVWMVMIMMMACSRHTYSAWWCFVQHQEHRYQENVYVVATKEDVGNYGLMQVTLACPVHGDRVPRLSQRLKRNPSGKVIQKFSAWYIASVVSDSTCGIWVKRPCIKSLAIAHSNKPDMVGPYNVTGNPTPYLTSQPPHTSQHTHTHTYIELLLFLLVVVMLMATNRVYVCMLLSIQIKCTLTNIQWNGNTSFADRSKSVLFSLASSYDLFWCRGLFGTWLVFGATCL